jgi:FdhE protein
VSRSRRDRAAELAREQPSFEPWLSLVEIALEAARDPAWDAAARAVVPAAEGEVALAGATIAVEARAAAALVERLRAAAGSRPVEPGRLLAAAIAQDASLLGGDESLVPLADLASLPLLQACGRRFAERAAGWSQGHCPICGAWPTLAELRGLDRARRLRCGRCGADWASVPLLCPFCGNLDHESLPSLVPETGGDSRRVDACDRCRGYVKTLASLGALAPELLPLEDLASVELDLAALDRGYRRPEAAPGAPGVRVAER